MGQPFRLYGVEDLYARPLFFGFGESGDSRGVRLEFDNAAINAEHLLNDEGDAAFIGAIEYARNSSDFSLYPSIGVTSLGQSKTILLCMRERLRSISTLAVSRVSTTEVVLAKIILSEKYGCNVAIVPALGSVVDMLEKADSALVVGNHALQQKWEGPWIDLVDEWTDVTELPFVHLLGAGRKGKGSKELESLLVSAKDRGTALFDRIAAEQSAVLHIPADVLEDQLQKYEYGFSPLAHQSLNEFFRLGFYLGILPDIPDVEEFHSQ